MTDGMWNPSCNVPKGFHSLRRPYHDKARNTVTHCESMTYLSSSWSSERILSRTEVTISVRAMGGMVVVRKKNGISS